MATPPTPTPPPAPAPEAAAAQMLSPPVILGIMLRTGSHVSDFIFSPVRPPQVEQSGQLVPVEIQGMPLLRPEDTASFAAHLIGTNNVAMEKLRSEGSCDISYSLPRQARFRVNIFTQRGSCAIVMRVIPNVIPSFSDLNLPPQLMEIVGLKNGIVLVTGPTGSGKSSTLAALIDKINEDKACHILTIEDPIEFLHPHKKSTIHQRELYSDTPSFAKALRQAPKVILVGEMRDKETIEIAMEAAETGHLVCSTLHTIDVSKTVERLCGVFPLSEQATIRNRFAKSFRFIVSQRLLPRAGASGRVAAFEILKSTIRTREYLEKGEGAGKTLLDAMRGGDLEGMQHFDGEIEKLIRNRVVDLETGCAYATNPGNLRLELSDFAEELPEATTPGN